MPTLTHISEGDPDHAGKHNAERDEIEGVKTALEAKVGTSDARLTDQRVPTDSSVTNVKVASGAAIDQSKINGLTTALAGKVNTTTLGAASGVATLGSDSKLTASQVPTLVRSSWSTLHLDRDFAASFGNGHWSGALDELKTALAEGGTWTMDPVDHPIAKPVPMFTKAQQKFITPEIGPFWAYLNDSAGYVKGGRFSVISASTPNGLGVSGTPNGFVGDCMVYIPDYANNSGVEINNCMIQGLTLDGGSRLAGDGTTLIKGVKREGLVRGLRAYGISIAQTSDTGWADVAFSNRIPRGGAISDLTVYSAGNSGNTSAWGVDIRMTDGQFGLIWAVDCSNNVRINDPGQIGSSLIQAVFSRGIGVLFTGGDGSLATGNGGGNFSKVITDGNFAQGVLIETTGRNRLNFGIMDLRRDGRNGNTGADGTDKSADPTGLYPALELRGTAGNLVCPVDIGILSTAVEDDDANNKVWSPHVAVRWNQYISRFSFNGHIWAYSTTMDGPSAVSDLIRIGDETTSFYTGRPTAKVNAFPDIRRGKTRRTLIFSTGQAFTNMPQAESTWGSASNSRLRETSVDLRGQNYGRILAKVTTSSSSANTPVIYAQASTDNGATWTTITGNAGIGTGTGGTAVASGWVSIPAAMKTDAVIRCASSGGDGVEDPSIFDVTLETRP